MMSPPAALHAGKFLLTPLVRSTAHGIHTALLSIRRGRGSQTHDHVYTFCPEFGDAPSALRYALAQAQTWLDNPRAFA